MRADDAEEWENAGAVARAFKLGKFESQAIANLQKRMPRHIAGLLKDAVSARGMKPFLLHETVAKDIFNLAFSSGDGEKEAWAVQLTNTESNGLAPGRKLFCEFPPLSWISLSSA